MKKIAILLVFTLGTFIVNAQSVVEGTKFMDNWSVGVNAGAVTPLTHASFFKRDASRFRSWNIQTINS